MESNGAILCDNLIKWLQTLNLTAKHENPAELSDGVAIAEALTQIAPEYFTPSWNSKVKTDVGTNWRLKVSNLKKILEGVVDYHQDILSLSLQDFSRPDVVNIAENADPSDLGRLLQLVLSCAVNCIKKEEYITRIMELELSCQRCIMQAIQELETLTLGNRGSLHVDGAADQTDADMREVLAQRCHELDTQELETLTLGNRGSLHVDGADQTDQTDADMREVLAQRCHELDTQVLLYTGT
ncbi:HOOK protein domain-containing protein [Phthorimaea operculella]|nr:HOOK protein domain-containing protein [Phthorimaea operculella]